MMSKSRECNYTFSSLIKINKKIYILRKFVFCFLNYLSLILDIFNYYKLFQIYTNYRSRSRPEFVNFCFILILVIKISIVQNRQAM